LPAGHFHFDYSSPLEPATRLGNLPDLIQIKSHVFSDLRPAAAPAIPDDRPN